MSAAGSPASARSAAEWTSRRVRSTSTHISPRRCATTGSLPSSSPECECRLLPRCSRAISTAAAARPV